MAFQVRVRVNKNEIKVLSVASSSEEFEQFTIRELKEKALSFFPSVDDPDRLRVIFGQSELEDSQTLDSCDIEHLSVLIIVLQVPGGARATSPVEMYCSRSNTHLDTQQHFIQVYTTVSLHMASRKKGYSSPEIHPGRVYLGSQHIWRMLGL